MIRVLQVVSGMNRGGLETFIMNVYRKIDREKIQFDFLVEARQACTYDQEILSLGGKIYKVVPRNEGIIKNRQAIRNFFRNNKQFKIVHIHMGSLSNVNVLLEARSANVPMRIIHAHSIKADGLRIHTLLHYIHRFKVKNLATHFFACSDLAGKWMYGNNNFEIINNGIDTEAFQYNVDVRKDIRTSLNIDNKFVIGNIGRFSKVKNHDFLVEIFNKIHIINKDAVLMCVGDGILRKRIEQKINDLGLKNHVIFTGERTDVHKLVQAMDVLVMPSLNEGFPVVLVEAQAAGLMCLISDTVTKQTDITGLINFVNLNSSADYWAKATIEKGNSYTRKSTNKLMRINGFEISDVATKLLKLYTLNNEGVL